MECPDPLFCFGDHPAVNGGISILRAAIDRAVNGIHLVGIRFGSCGRLFLEAFGVSRRLVVPLVYAAFLIMLAAIPAVFAPVIYAQLDAIQAEILSFQESFDEFLLRANLTGLVQGDDITDFFSFLYNPQRIFGVMLAATENLAWILIITVSTFYILLDWDRLRAFILESPPEPYRQDIQIIYSRVKGIWQAYLRGQLVLMITVGILSWLAGSLVGLPDALLIGIIAGALDIIPSLGPIVAMVIATLVAFFQGSIFLDISNIWFAVLILGIFTTIQMIENIWLRPRILSQRVHLHPALVFVAIVGSLGSGGCHRRPGHRSGHQDQRISRRLPYSADIGPESLAGDASGSAYSDHITSPCRSAGQPRSTKASNAGLSTPIFPDSPCPG
jgi:predicted PurR-regulated permease PerM